MKYTVYKHGWDDSCPGASIPIDIEYGPFDSIDKARSELKKCVDAQDIHIDNDIQESCHREEKDDVVQWSFPKVFIEIGIYKQD